MAKNPVQPWNKTLVRSLFTTLANLLKNQHRFIDDLIERGPSETRGVHRRTYGRLRGKLHRDEAIFASTNDRNHCQKHNREATRDCFVDQRKQGIESETQRDRGSTETRYDVKSYGDADNDVVTYAQA